MVCNFRDNTPLLVGCQSLSVRPVADVGTIQLYHPWTCPITTVHSLKKWPIATPLLRRLACRSTLSKAVNFWGSSLDCQLRTYPVPAAHDDGRTISVVTYHFCDKLFWHTIKKDRFVWDAHGTRERNTTLFNCSRKHEFQTSCAGLHLVNINTAEPPMRWKKTLWFNSTFSTALHCSEQLSGIEIEQRNFCNR